MEVAALADKSIVHVAAGRDASYAVSSDGSVWAWGSDALGEIGDGPGTATRQLTPVKIPGLSGVVELGVGRNHVLARTSSGKVYAWGDNKYGQVGDGTLSRRFAPVQLSLPPIAHVDAGAHHSLAVTTSGDVLSWGRGYRGQLGNGSTASRNVPAKVSGLPPVVDVGDGRDQSFAMTASGALWAWGSNAAGQLGDGSTMRRTRPVLTGVTGVAVAQGGSEHTIFFGP